MLSALLASVLLAEKQRLDTILTARLEQVTLPSTLISKILDHDTALQLLTGSPDGEIPEALQPLQAIIRDEATFFLKQSARLIWLMKLFPPDKNYQCMLDLNQREAQHFQNLNKIFFREIITALLNKMKSKQEFEDAKKEFSVTTTTIEE